MPYFAIAAHFNDCVYALMHESRETVLFAKTPLMLSSLVVPRHFDVIAAGRLVVVDGHDEVSDLGDVRASDCLPEGAGGPHDLSEFDGRDFRVSVRLAQPFALEAPPCVDVLALQEDLPAAL